MLKCASFAAIRPQFDGDLIRHLGVPKQIGRSQFYFQKSNRQSFLYIAVVDGPSHGQRQHMQKKLDLVVFELCERTDKQICSSRYFASLPPSGKRTKFETG